MTDITSSESTNSVIELANNVVESTPVDSFMSIVTKKFSENKMYVYIGIAVIVLGIVLYYFYIKNKKETKAKPDNKPKLELPEPVAKQAVEPSGNNNQTAYATVPEISSDEYWVMDAQGRPVKVSGGGGGGFQQTQIAPLPIPNQAPSAGEIKMLQQQMVQQQHMQQQHMQQQQMQQQQQQQQHMQQQMQQQIEHQKRLSAEHKASQQNIKSSKKSQQKIKHPEESEADLEDESDDINVELARINAIEDDNVAQHNLTNSELAEITKKLEIMGSKLGA